MFAKAAWNTLNPKPYSRACQAAVVVGQSRSTNVLQQDLMVLDLGGFRV